MNLEGFTVQYCRPIKLLSFGYVRLDKCTALPGCFRGEEKMKEANDNSLQVAGKRLQSRNPSITASGDAFSNASLMLVPLL